MFCKLRATEKKNGTLLKFLFRGQLAKLIAAAGVDCIQPRPVISGLICTTSVTGKTGCAGLSLGSKWEQVSQVLLHLRFPKKSGAETGVWKEKKLLCPCSANWIKTLFLQLQVTTKIFISYETNVDIAEFRLRQWTHVSLFCEDGNNKTIFTDTYTSNSHLYIGLYKFWNYQSFIPRLQENQALMASATSWLRWR